MNILVFNCGSSSLSYKVFSVNDPENPKIVMSGKAHRVGVKGSEPSFVEHKREGTVRKQEVPIPDHREAANLILKHVIQNEIPVDLIGHRFVHGGSYFQKSSLLDSESLKKLKLCLPLASIHNPASMSAILACSKTLRKVRQYVTFDSAFHVTIPSHAYLYALPAVVTRKYGFRKYGFHGLSYQYVTREAARQLVTPLETLKIVACHLGTGGSSVAAVDRGRSIDTSMGYSPLPGLMMSTRSGDIDPMVAIYAMIAYGYRAEDLETILNKRSGLLGVSGFSSDIRDILRNMDENEGEQEELAFTMYVHRLKKYIGSFVLALGGVDALVFTDDIGAGNPRVRERVCRNMEWCGISLDEEVNRRAGPDRTWFLSAKDARVQVLSIPTEEELMICQEGIPFLGVRHAAAV